MAKIKRDALFPLGKNTFAPHESTLKGKPVPRMMTVAHSSGLLSLISAAVTPVVLISAVAILLGTFTTKYINLATQMRALTHEYRQSDTSEPRQASIRHQLMIFHHRVAAAQTSSVFLLFAVLSFMGTVLSLVFATLNARLSLFAKISLECGLIFIVAALLIELYEIRLARYTVLYEIQDILAPPIKFNWSSLTPFLRDR